MGKIQSDEVLADSITYQLNQAAEAVKSIAAHNKVVGDNTKVQLDCHLVYSNGRKAIAAYTEAVLKDNEHLRGLGVELQAADRKIEEEIMSGGSIDGE